MSKYQIWHDAIILHARSRKKLACYGEWHHIVPKSHGGHDGKTNLVHLTYREHFLIHWIWTKIATGGELRSMQRALFAMTLRVQGRPQIPAWRSTVAARATRDMEEDPIVAAQRRETWRQARIHIIEEKVSDYKEKLDARRNDRVSVRQKIDARLSEARKPSKAELDQMTADLLNSAKPVKADIYGFPVRGSSGGKLARSKLKHRKAELEQRFGWKCGIVKNSEPQKIDQVGMINKAWKKLREEGEAQRAAESS